MILKLYGKEETANENLLNERFVHLMLSSKCYRPEILCKKDVLKNFAKFTEKHLCQSHFFNNVVVLRPATLLKRRFWHRCFPVSFAKFLRTSFFIEHPWWLLLELVIPI